MSYLNSFFLKLLPKSPKPTTVQITRVAEITKLTIDAVEMHCLTWGRDTVWLDSGIKKRPGCVLRDFSGLIYNCLVLLQFVFKCENQISQRHQAPIWPIYSYSKNQPWRHVAISTGGVQQFLHYYLLFTPLNSLLWKGIYIEPLTLRHRKVFSPKSYCCDSTIQRQMKIWAKGQSLSETQIITSTSNCSSLWYQFVMTVTRRERERAGNRVESNVQRDNFVIAKWIQ